MSNLAGEESIADNDRLAPLPADRAGRHGHGHDPASSSTTTGSSRCRPPRSRCAMQGGRDEDWRFDPATGTVFGRGVTTRRAHVHGGRRASRGPPPRLLAAAQPLPADDRRAAAVHATAGPRPARSWPRSPTVIGERARPPYERVRRIHAFLTDRANGFRYSLSTEPGHQRRRPGRLPPAAPRLLRAVRRRDGGHGPGGRRARPGGPGLHAGQVQPDGSRLITTDDAHAWVEVYFQGLGWVPFDPTPISAGRAADLPWAPRADAATGSRNRAAAPAPGAHHGRPAAPARTAAATARHGHRGRGHPPAIVAGARRGGAVLVLASAGRPRPRPPGAAAPTPAGDRDAPARCGTSWPPPRSTWGCGCSRPGRPRRAAQELAEVVGRGGDRAGDARGRPSPAGPGGGGGQLRAGRRGTAGAGAGSGAAGGAPGAAAVRRAATPAAGPAVAGLAGRRAAGRRPRLGGRRLVRPASEPARAGLTRRHRPRNAAAAVPEGRRLREGAARLLVVAAAEALLEAVLQRLAADPATAAGPPGGRRYRGRRPGAAAGLDRAGGGLVVQDGEGDAAEGHQGAEAADEERTGRRPRRRGRRGRRRPGRRRAAACGAPSAGGRRCGRTRRTWDRHRRGRARSAPADAARARRAARRPPGGRSQGRRRLPPTVPPRIRALRNGAKGDLRGDRADDHRATCRSLFRVSALVSRDLRRRSGRPARGRARPARRSPADRVRRPSPVQQRRRPDRARPRSGGPRGRRPARRPGGRARGRRARAAAAPSPASTSRSARTPTSRMRARSRPSASKRARAVS